MQNEDTTKMQEFEILNLFTNPMQIVVANKPACGTGSGGCTCGSGGCSCFQ